MASAAEIRQAWLTDLFATEPSQRQNAEEGVRAMYRSAGLVPPEHVCWFDSPFAGSWAVALLVAPQHPVFPQLLDSASRRTGEREHLERARDALLRCVNAKTLEEARAAAGVPVGGRLQYMPTGAKLLVTGLLEARLALDDDVSKLFVTPPEAEQLQAAESALWSSASSPLSSGLFAPTTGSLLGVSSFADYSFTMMASDEAALDGRTPPPLLHAAWTVARNAGPWWAFANLVILSERPADIHHDSHHRLHRGDGPAMVYRDGWQIFAWEGKAMRPEWILRPESIAPGELRRLDRSFQAYLKNRGVASGPAARKPRISTIFKRPIPSDPSVRVAKLREHAGGDLMRFERYLAGEHEPVWRELIALGAAVREDPHAADALAVAYETMRRVDANIRTLVSRLQAIGYRFGARSSPHTPPTGGTPKSLAALQKGVGMLPLSLSAFYDVVGAVDLTGTHASLSSARDSVAPDPLVVYGVDEVLAAVDGEDEDDDSVCIPIAPDDLHKADTSGGDAYEMMSGDARADGELLNERHHLFFVDYLRLVFKYGGFPGFEGVDARRPPEIEMLAAGLLPF